MAKRGRKFVFEGAYESKAAAVRAEKRHPGSFIIKRKIRGETREIVMKRRRK